MVLRLGQGGEQHFFCSCLVVFAGSCFCSFVMVGMGRFWLEFTFGRVSCGSASGLELFGPMGWQWVEEATALSSVVLLDGPECRGKTEQPRWHTAADKHYPHSQCWSSKNRAMDRQTDRGAH